ncbi:MAG: hypothetical protein K7J47_11170 [Acidobacteria bacterium]|nr:hypothetical protein [Bryobacteraceae bacterium CoA2 C42]
MFPAEPLRFTVAQEAGPLPRVVMVRGDAYSLTRRITSATVAIAGVAYGSALLGQNRAALCAARAKATGSPNCPDLGWQAQLNTAAAAPALGNGLYRMQIRITEEGADDVVAGEAVIVCGEESGESAADRGGEQPDECAAGFRGD